MATENYTPKYIIIKLIDEILIESIDNHNNTVTVKEFMYEKFGENNFYIIGENEYGIIFLTIVNRKKEITIILNRFLILILILKFKIQIKKDSAITLQILLWLTQNY